MKQILFLFFVGITISIFSQNIQQTAVIQSSGAGFTQTASYRHEAIVGTVATGIITQSTYSGSNVGFLHPTSTQNFSPTAYAGSDIIVVENSIVNLNASLSSDPEGNPLTYTWTPLTGTVLNNNSVVNPSFTALPQKAQRKYRFQLQVSDGVNLSNLDTVVVTVRDTAWQPVIYTNSCVLVAVPSFNSNYTQVPDVVGAFEANTGECRGVEEVKIINGLPYALFNIQTLSNDNIAFKVYDYSLDSVCQDPNTYIAVAQGNLGTPANPLSINGICSTISVFPPLIMTFALYPNPAEDNFTIEWAKSLTQPTNVEVINVMGQTVHSETVAAGQNILTIETPKLTSGVYLVRVNEQQVKLVVNQE